jgi:hypothetical protein
MSNSLSSAAHFPIRPEASCWGPSSSEDPQKCDQPYVFSMIMNSYRNLRLWDGELISYDRTKGNKKWATKLEAKRTSAGHVDEAQV